MKREQWRMHAELRCTLRNPSCLPRFVVISYHNKCWCPGGLASGGQKSRGPKVQGLGSKREVYATVSVLRHFPNQARRSRCRSFYRPLSGFLSRSCLTDRFINYALVECKTVMHVNRQGIVLHPVFIRSDFIPVLFSSTKTAIPFSDAPLFGSWSRSVAVK